MGVNWKEIKSILQNFNAFYWNSEMVNNISLINDLRLSTNIHETAHSRILYKPQIRNRPHKMTQRSKR